MPQTPPLYSDLNQANPRRQVLLRDYESVVQSIENIVSTVPGERFFNPTFGSNLEDPLFELMDEITRLQTETLIFVTINTWDPRVLMDKTNTLVSGVPDDNTYDINLVFDVVGLPRAPYVYNGTLAHR